MDHYSNLGLENTGKHTISVGPWGGQDGFHWDDGVYSTVRQLEIAHGAGIDSIRIEYDRNGASVWSEKHGGNGGPKTDKVRLDYPDEFLTSIHGHYGNLQAWGTVLVRSLTFVSNKRTYGPYGIEQGTYFTFPTSSKIVGFHGKCGWYLDAIGVYLEPIHKPIASNSIIQSQSYGFHRTEEYEHSLIQGSFGTNYDLIVAVRKKDDHNNSLVNNLSRQTSREFSYAEPKNETAHVNPNKIERIPSKNVKGVLTYGPWGGNRGNLFDDGVYDGIRQINLSRSVGIVSLRVCYEQNGQPVWGSKNGGTGGFKKDKIVFDYPSEILTHITGYYGPAMIMGPEVIKSLIFHTTKGKYGPYGEEGGTYFSTNLKERMMIVGFHGRKGLFIDAIGFHVIEGKAVPASIPSSKSSYHNAVPTKSKNKIPTSNSASMSNNHTSLLKNKAEIPQWFSKIGKQSQTGEVVQRLPKDPATYGPGPWGGDGGKPWDDGVFSGIKQIILTRTEAISCIEIEYDRNGQSVWSVKHGGNGGQISNQVKLEYPHEVLTCISGYYGPISVDQGKKVVKSLTFHTSRKKYGPFGEELGSFFTSNTTEGIVVGFHGRSSMDLDAIGVHMQYWSGNKRSSKPSSLMKIFS
ncbi:jacalin-related lectin 3 [Olea europaea var. sylvestris]|uniref:jacalin-related lectin 3 n=1 Tax=Olea europaea var. sylvestris TaxID=158386 RepID=UPI000C1D49BB|nr:jacalin-related lectin 3 [Olea europaea var. sylvestris]